MTLRVAEPKKSSEVLKHLIRHDVKSAITKARLLFNEIKNQSGTGETVGTIEEAELMKWIVKSLMIDQRNPWLFIEVLPFCHA